VQIISQPEGTMSLYANLSIAKEAQERREVPRQNSAPPSKRQAKSEALYAEVLSKPAAQGFVETKPLAPVGQQVARQPVAEAQGETETPSTTAGM
jgi:hypothetical protein